MFHLHLLYNLLSSIYDVVSMISLDSHGVGGGGISSSPLSLSATFFLASPSRLHPLARPLLAAEAFWKCRRTSFILFPSWLSLGSFFLHDSFLKVLGEPVSQKL
jgi:hypothetical protein